MGTLKPKKSGVYVLTVLMLACITLIWVLSRVYLSPHLPEWEFLSLIPQTARQTAAPPNEQGLGPEGYLPPGTTLLETLQADLDNDGASEDVLIFNSQEHPYEQGMGGALVLDRDTNQQGTKTWQMRPPSEGRVAEPAIRDINLDGVLELLLYKSTEDGSKHLLHVFAWNGTEYAPLGPDGEGALVSAYYPAEVRNIDLTDSEEIVLFEGDGSSERLRAVVYRWDGEGYARAPWIIMLGPSRPSREDDQ